MEMKRLFDVVVSFFVIVLIFPLLLIIAFAIMIDSPGNPLFFQERIGKEGKVFKIIKFRTMIKDAEKSGDGVFVYSNSDSRITRFGNFLRKSSLDELPQLFNILFGSMSFVGPRPPVTYHPYDGYENYPDWAKKRFEMRPGLTGLAQIEYRDSADWDIRMKKDIEYVENFSIVYDFKLILLTVLHVVKHALKR